MAQSCVANKLTCCVFQFTHEYKQGKKKSLGKGGFCFAEFKKKKNVMKTHTKKIHHRQFTKSQGQVPLLPLSTTFCTQPHRLSTSGLRYYIYSRQRHEELYLNKHKQKWFMIVYSHVRNNQHHVFSLLCKLSWFSWRQDNANNRYKLRTCLSISQNTLMPHANVRKDDFYSRNGILLLRKILKTFSIGTLCYRFVNSWSSNSCATEGFSSFFFFSQIFYFPWCTLFVLYG